MEFKNTPNDVPADSSTGWKVQIFIYLFCSKGVTITEE